MNENILHCTQVSELISNFLVVHVMKHGKDEFEQLVDAKTGYTADEANRVLSRALQLGQRVFRGDTTVNSAWVPATEAAEYFFVANTEQEVLGAIRALDDRLDKLDRTNWKPKLSYAHAVNRALEELPEVDFDEIEKVVPIYLTGDTGAEATLMCHENVLPKAMEHRLNIFMARCPNNELASIFLLGKTEEEVVRKLQGLAPSKAAKKQEDPKELKESVSEERWVPKLFMHGSIGQALNYVRNYSPSCLYEHLPTFKIDDNSLQVAFEYGRIFKEAEERKLHVFMGRWPHEPNFVYFLLGSLLEEVLSKLHEVAMLEAGQ